MEAARPGNLIFVAAKAKYRRRNPPEAEEILRQGEKQVKSEKLKDKSVESGLRGKVDSCLFMSNA